MNLSFKPLTINDCDQLIELINQRPHVFNGYHDPDWHKSIIETVPSWFQDPLYFLPAIWKDGNIVLALVIKESPTTPSWAWGHWISRHDSARIMYTTEGVEMFRETDRQIFDEMEINRKLNRMMLSYRIYDSETNHLKNAGMSDRMFEWMRRHNYRVSNYKFYTDCEVEANTEAKYPYQRALLGNRTWPFKTAIRLGMLIQR